MKKTLIILAVIFGIIFIALAIFYWVTPANMLPMFLPGYDAAMAAPHIKHGIASLVLGLALLIYAWFASAKKVS
jgi:F0F1-type ATP synthase membrane subunit a